MLTSSHLPGIIIETFLGGIVEVILLIILISRDQAGELVRVIRDAILGSILANLLLCLGLCFFVGGLRQEKQHFDGAVSEVGSGLLFTAAFALIIPTAFTFGIGGTITSGGVDPNAETENLVLDVSRATAIVLWLAFFVYVFTLGCVPDAILVAESTGEVYSLTFWQLRLVPDAHAPRSLRLDLGSR